MKAVWKGISKKFDWLGISRFSMVCAGLALVIASPKESLYQCTLWALMLNAIAYAYPIKCLSFEGQFNEVSRND
ncbi:hypothetical protein CGK15_22375 [Vibrio parahaemolyticus]|uniref:DUF3693 domain-containing protein n=1 Tax=Vibrio parahaemolyticus TaxID=670 RepID=UPI00111F8A7A|nr:DUF3693 domain-containing protein [Vibrio parahaemolyticus]TOA46628.1 hypothetical protein CGK25_18395 [Vibrio parahaemolyticus]TOA95255.1 hypothetical protein CGK15_22375 [Vibrio parahaemolyticus]